VSEEARFSTSLHRIEVHAGAHAKTDEFIWQVTVGEVAGLVALWGYMRCSMVQGYGQAQVVGTTLVWKFDEVSKNKASRAEFAEWVQQYASEVMYDTARRALQVQAALMDFSFDMATEAPTATVQFEKRDAPRATRRPKSARAEALSD